MAGTGDETAAANGRSRGELRASRDDRERVIELLKVAFVEERLTKDELDARTGQALASRTHADLAAVTADLPAATAELPVATGGLPAATAVLPGRVLAVSTVLYVGVWPLAIVAPRDHEGDARAGLALVLAAGLVYVAVLLVVVACLLDSRQENRPGGQPSQRPAPQTPLRLAARAPRPSASAEPGDGAVGSHA
jgi:Domain of unknown function (DUF1707)